MTNPLLHTGHRSRLKERLSHAGADSFLDHEFLELLLTYVIARKDTKALAWTLLKRFGSIASVLDASETALLQVEGVGHHTAQFLNLICSSFKRYMRAKIPQKVNLSTPQAVLDYCTASLAGKEDEFLEAIFLSARHAVLETRVLSVGSAAQVAFDPRQIVRQAITTNAVGVILVHNHPSGDPHPSQEDLQCTSQLSQGLRLFDISLWDHIIITQGAYFSFREAGYLSSSKQ